VEAKILMDPIGHWAFGFICGTLIILPFIKDRSIYDYDSQKWVSVKWRKVTRGANKWFIFKRKPKPVRITNELHLITRSRFIIYHLIFANLCGIIAYLPDIGQLWGDSTTDHHWWADAFFFHRTFDNMSFGTINTISFEIFLVVCAIILWFAVIIYAWSIQYDNKSIEIK